MKSSDISLVPLSADKFNSLRTRVDVVPRDGQAPRLGVNHDGSKQSTVFTGFCDKFDLSTEDGRNGYAALSARLLPGTELLRLWEERVPGPNGTIYIYVSYVQVLDVYQTGTENFDLRDEA